VSRFIMTGEDAEHLRIDCGDGLRLHVAVSGSGPALVMLHGFTGSESTWKPFRSVFAVSHTVVAIDLPGHGRSSVPNDPDRYRLGRFADDLATVLDELEIDSATILGYSMGARAAMRFAATNHELVAGLILESASPGISGEPDRAERRLADCALADSIERDGIGAFVDHWESLSLWDSQRSLSDETRAALRTQRLSGDPNGLANSLRGAGAGVDEPVVDQLGELNVPALLIAGELDAKYVQNATTLAAALPDARLVIVPGAGHAVHLERPMDFEREVLVFLNDPARAR
jgi:2-succinyl-6-hydroxy-2,4-cyclohexadiene-1-carboxylate synthase